MTDNDVDIVTPPRCPIPFKLLFDNDHDRKELALNDVSPVLLFVDRVLTKNGQNMTC